MNSILCDTISTVNGQPLGAAVLTSPITQNSDPLTWTEDRWLLGWSPWLGFGKGTVLECHLMLLVKGQRIFVIGPHKENPSTIYAYGGSEFFPSGYGCHVPAGTPIQLQLLANPTGNYAGVAANAIIFSVVI